MSETNDEHTLEKLTKNLTKKLFLAQNCLKRIMSQLLDYIEKIGEKIEKKNQKIIFGSDLSETNNEPIFRLQPKNKEIEKNYFCS